MPHVEFHLREAGDSAIVVELPERIDPETNGWCIALADSLERRLGTALRDVAIGYCTVTVYFDPLAVEERWILDEIAAAAASTTAADRPEGPLLDVPVCYGGEFGPDLADVANFGGCTAEDVIGWHAAALYRVYLVGFVPGFPYMAEVDRRIAAPRRATPRTAVPVGSVAIAGGQTGIYPAVTPGGWNLIGRTPVKPYDPARRQPFLFTAGDRVRFHPISVDEFHRLE